MVSNTGTPENTEPIKGIASPWTQERYKEVRIIYNYVSSEGAGAKAKAVDEYGVYVRSPSGSYPWERKL